MKSPEQYQPTPEERTKVEKQRAKTETELIRDGAEYVVDNNKKRLEVTGKQNEKAKQEMKKEIKILEEGEKDGEKALEELNPIREQIKKEKMALIEKAESLLSEIMRELGQTIKSGDEMQKEKIFRKFNTFLTGVKEDFNFKEINDKSLEQARIILQKWGGRKNLPIFGQR